MTSCICYETNIYYLHNLQAKFIFGYMSLNYRLIHILHKMQHYLKNSLAACEIYRRPYGETLGAFLAFSMELSINCDDVKMLNGYLVMLVTSSILCRNMLLCCLMMYVAVKVFCSSHLTSFCQWSFIQMTTADVETNK